MLGIAIADEPSSRIRYDRRATSPAVVAFLASEAAGRAMSE